MKVGETPDPIMEQFRQDRVAELELRKIEAERDLAMAQVKVHNADERRELIVILTLGVMVFLLLFGLGYCSYQQGQNCLEVPGRDWNGMVCTEEVAD